MQADPGGHCAEKVTKHLQAKVALKVENQILRARLPILVFCIWLAQIAISRLRMGQHLTGRSVNKDLPIANDVAAIEDLHRLTASNLIRAPRLAGFNVFLTGKGRYLIDN